MCVCYRWCLPMYMKLDVVCLIAMMTSLLSVTMEPGETIIHFQVNDL